MLTAIALVFITPYLFSVFAAFKPCSQILAQSARSAEVPYLANFKYDFVPGDFGRYLANTRSSPSSSPRAR